MVSGKTHQGVGGLTGAILVHDVNSKLETVVLVEDEGVALDTLGGQPPSVQEGAVARLEIANVDLSVK